MLDSYRRVLRTPGALAFSSAALIGRLPISMVGLGLVLLVESRSGSYGLAGSVTAVFVLAEAAMAVIHGRWVDRFGQGLVLSAAICVFGVAMTLLVIAVENDASRAVIYGLAVLAGGSLPQLGASVRSRWSHVLDRPDEVATAFALESVLDEVVFVVGPVLVTMLATAWHPILGLTVAITSGVVGTLAFSAQRRTEPPPSGPRTRESAEAMPWGVVLALAFVCLMLGTLFGAAEVTTVAFADERGITWAAGWLLAAWSLGSLLAGLITGAFTWRVSPVVRLRWGGAAMAVAMAPLPFIDSPAVMAAVLFVGGGAIAPTLISALTMVEQSVPRARLTEGMAIIHTGIVAGVAPGAGIAGYVIDHSSSAGAYVVGLVAGLAVALTTLLVRSSATTLRA